MAAKPMAAHSGRKPRARASPDFGRDVRRGRFHQLRVFRGRVRLNASVLQRGDFPIRIVLHAAS